MAILAAGVFDVMGAVIGVVLGLTGAALAILGAFSAMEGTPKRGLVGLVVGALCFALGLMLVGFL